MRGIATLMGMTANTGERADRGRGYPEGPGDIPADTFGLRMMVSRHHAGRLSIEQAAARCGINPGNWAHWENGRRPLDKVEIARSIADGLGVNFNWLLLGGPLVPVSGRPPQAIGRAPRRDSFEPLDRAERRARQVNEDSPTMDVRAAASSVTPAVRLPACRPDGRPHSSARRPERVVRQPIAV